MSAPRKGNTMGITNTNADYAGEASNQEPKVVDQLQNLEATTQEQHLEEAFSETNPNLVHEDDTEVLDEVKEISQFATGIYNWHTHIVNQAIHVVNMPERQQDDPAFIQVKVTAKGHPDTDPETGMRILKAEEIPAFKAGVQYMLDMFQELPYKFLPTDADDNVVPEYASLGNDDAEKELP